MKFRFLILAFLLLPMTVFSQILTDSNLPIVIINTDGGVNIPDEPKVLADMKIIWHQDGSRNYVNDQNNPEFLNYNGRIGIELRGSSSQMLQKKPYGLETLQADNVTNNNVSLLGMPKENDWVLNSLAFDQTGMRDVISYELSEKLGQYAPRRVYCEVIINNDYKGLYAFMEKIKVDDNRVNVQKLESTNNSYPEVTGGYITKADKTTGNDPVAWTMPEYGWSWGVDYIHHYPKPDDITTAQHNYIKSVFFDLADKAGSHSTSITDGIPSIIDLRSFIDFMLVAEYSSNVDVYKLSTFFHKDRKGKLRAGPVWDYNLAYGHDEFGNRSRYDVWQFDNNDNNGSKFWKDMFDTDMFRCCMAKRWFEVTAPGMPMNYAVICDRIDEIDEWIAEGVARDNQRWHQMNQHASEVQAMKTWIYQRINWLNQNIGTSNICNDDTPPLVISKINYHPIDTLEFGGTQLEFIQINNNSDSDIDLTGVYFSELGITYRFPNGSHLAARDSVVLCSDSMAYMSFYKSVPFGQYMRNLSNKSERIVLADAWGNIIDEVHYSDSEPWPIEADGQGAFLQLIDLDLDNSLPESWRAGYIHNGTSNVNEIAESERISIYPNPSNGIVNINSDTEVNSVEIIDITGRIIMRRHDKHINVSQLPNGFYNLKIYTKDAIAVRKLTVSH